MTENNQEIKQPVTPNIEDEDDAMVQRMVDGGESPFVAYGVTLAEIAQDKPTARFFSRIGLTPGTK